MYKEIRKRVSLTTAMLLTFSYISFGPITLKPVEGSTRTNVVTEELVESWDFESGTDDGVGDNHGVIIGDAEVVDGAEITTIAAINVITQVGTPPQLPEKVTVTYGDTTTEELEVVWAEIPETEYSEIGSFTVEGNVAGTEIKAVANVTVVVEKEIDLDVNGDKKVNVGDLGIVARYFGYSKVKNPDVWETMKQADVDGNEAIELLDLILVAREILKK